MTCNDRQFWIDRIATVKAQILALDEAFLGLSTGAIQQYQLDTGQTRMLVTKANMATLRDTISALENKLATLNARVYGAGVRVVPGW
jgi:hypothetical protein